MVRARFNPKAARDLNEISDRIAADNPEAAERVRHLILNTADFIAQHPEIGRRIRKAAAKPPANPLVRRAEVPQLSVFLPAVPGNRHGSSRSARGAGLDAVLACGVGTRTVSHQADA
jgi:plasmid stabilization system protein ParE